MNCFVSDDKLNSDGFMEENQLVVLDYIEEYLNSINKRMIPYDVYIITTVDNYTGPLSIFSEMNSLPHHYRRKNRPLNTKEANIMKKIVFYFRKVF